MTEATYLLPVPPSTNNLFANKGRKRIRADGYEAWRNEALAMLIHQQRARPFPTPCIITINVSDSVNGDADNRMKACLDILVTARVIPDDSKQHVRRVSIGWEPVEGCTVHLQQITDPRPAAAATGRRGSHQDRTSLGRASPPNILDAG